MRKLLAATAVSLFAITTVAAAPAAQNDPPEGFVASLEIASGESAGYDGAAGSGGATMVDGCDGTVGHCDFILVETKAGGTVDFNFTAAYDPADFDVNVYLSDADGTIGEEVASSGNFYFPVSTGAGFEPNEFGSFETSKAGFYAVEINYFAAGGGYSFEISLS